MNTKPTLLDDDQDWLRNGPCRKKTGPSTRLSVGAVKHSGSIAECRLPGILAAMAKQQQIIWTFAVFRQLVHYQAKSRTIVQEGKNLVMAAAKSARRLALLVPPKLRVALGAAADVRICPAKACGRDGANASALRNRQNEVVERRRAAQVSFLQEQGYNNARASYRWRERREKKRRSLRDAKRQGPSSGPAVFARCARAPCRRLGRGQNLGDRVTLCARP
jgi:hypothetical protein